MPKTVAHLGAAGAGDGRHGSVLSEGHFGAGAPAQGKRLLSGAQPSRRDAEGFAEDIEMTRNIQRIATSMGLRLLDHLIVGDGACYSIREDGLL